MSATEQVRQPKLARARALVRSTLKHEQEARAASHLRDEELLKAANEALRDMPREHSGSRRVPLSQARSGSTYWLIRESVSIPSSSMRPLKSAIGLRQLTGDLVEMRRQSFLAADIEGP